jgi:hypothetical protein
MARLAFVPIALVFQDQSGDCENKLKPETDCSTGHDFDRPAKVITPFIMEFFDYRFKVW